MNKLKISGGILPLFRIFVFIKLFWALFTLLMTLGHSNSSSNLVPLFVVTGFGECLFLVAYLSWPWLEKRMGNFHLPIGLFIATFSPWVDNWFFLSFFQSNIQQISNSTGLNIDMIKGFLVIATQMQLAFVLFVPLILISWQYPLKWTIIFSISMAVLDSIQMYSQLTFTSRPNAAIPGSLLALFSLFLFTGFIVNRLSFEQKEHNRQLSHYADTLEHLATSRERNRLAREIHDTLAHTLSGLAVNLEAVTALWDNDPPQAKGILQQSLNVTRNGLVETRRAIQALRAGPLDDLGLTLALKQLALSSAERYSLEPKLDFSDHFDEIEPAVEQCIYRIAEEGLRNICQHAQASHFVMSLTKKDDQLVFELTDNGHGFKNDSIEINEHFGLQGMRERAEAAGLKFQIHSQKGRGTTLKLVMEGYPK